MKLGKVGAFAAVGVLVLAGCNQGGSSGSGKGTINIAIELPQQGSELAASQPIINGIKLAVKDAGGSAGGWTIDIPNSVVLDDAKDGVHDPQTGAQNMTALVANPNVVAVIGPLNSGVAKVQIPLSNAAGLLQCSPANTNEGLTKPEFGALDIRKTNPTQDQLRPRRHDGRQPGSGGRPLHPGEAQHQDGLHRRQHRHLREGHRRQLPEVLRGERRDRRASVTARRRRPPTTPRC